MVSFSVMLGIGAKHFVNDRNRPMSSIGAILSFASTVAATNISWTPMTADYGVYHSADASRCASTELFELGNITNCIT